MGRKRKHSQSTPTRAKTTAIGVTEIETSPLSPDTDTVAGCLVGEATSGDSGSVDDGGADKTPLHRNAANERERARMRVLSRAFARLKTSLPWVPADTKLSKLDTLRLASCYIAHLSQLLAEEEDEEQSTRKKTGQNAADHGPIHAGGGGGLSNATISSTTSGLTNTNIHPLNLTWPFTFGIRNSSSTAAAAAAVGNTATSSLDGRSGAPPPPPLPPPPRSNSIHHHKQSPDRLERAVTSS